jgi:hypothetical protein
MKDTDFKITDDIPPHIRSKNHRTYRYPQIYNLKPGQGIFIPESEIKTTHWDISHPIRALLYERRKETGRKFRTRTDKLRGGVWILEDE